MKLLDGIRVLSLNHFLMGPAGAQILADLGADVIAVEPPGGAFQRNWAVGSRFVGGDSVNHLSTGRNKRCIAVDLKKPEGLAVVLRLIDGADVLMENYRPGTLDKLGLGVEMVRARNPRLIYASATGFGSSGPYRDRPGQDLLAQALTGLAAASGSCAGPPVAVGAAVLDHHGAVLYALGIVAALMARQRTGHGMTVEASLLGAGLDLQFEALACFLNGGYFDGARGPGQLATWFAMPPYGIYETADGHVALSMSPLADVAKAIEAPDIGGLDDKAAFARRGEIAGRIADRMRTRGSGMRRSTTTARSSRTRKCATSASSRSSRRPPEVRRASFATRSPMTASIPAYGSRHNRSAPSRARYWMRPATLQTRSSCCSRAKP
jgi:crotonobetainyl-CoA:carnitine CoA-transferase CaiB-like acyl-CoA transferase